jgi:hypothetical protein
MKTRIAALLTAVMMFFAMASTSVAQDKPPVEVKPEVGASQMTEEQLKLRLYEFLINSLEGAKDLLKKGGDLVIDELPKFVKDYCTWGVIDGLVSAAIWLAIIIVAIWLGRKLFYKAWGNKKKEIEGLDGDDEKTILTVVVVLLFIGCVLAGTLGLVPNVKQAFKAAYAPRAYIADKLLDELKPAPTGRR